VTERNQPNASPATTRRWVVRVVVVVAFLATVVVQGPRAVEILGQRVEQAARNSPRVALDAVGFAAQPAWLDRPLLLAVSLGLSPWLGSSVPILDDDALRRLREGLLSVPWVAGVGFERVFPDKIKLSLALRRPVLAVRDGEGKPLCLVDQQARMLPFVDTRLPVVHLYREGGRPTMPVALGAVCEEPRVRAAVGIALEWRDEFAPLVKDCPELVEVDTTNLGERWLPPIHPEVRVKVARGDGQPVLFGYDRPVDSARMRVPTATKAQVLNQILQRHPKLAGLVAGDLRMSRRWADYLQPRAAGQRDPFGPWNGEPPPPPK
jgi:hypothetical protein